MREGSLALRLLRVRATLQGRLALVDKPEEPAPFSLRLSLLRLAAFDTRSVVIIDAATA